jgi:hypothetical protein
MIGVMQGAEIPWPLGFFGFTTVGYWNADGLDLQMGLRFKLLYNMNCPATSSGCWIGIGG